MSALKTLVQCLLSARERPTDQVAVRFKRHNSWLSLTWHDYLQTCEAAGLGLRSLGVGPGDRVAVLSNTRLEWAALDFGIMGIGAITIPIYQSNRAEEVEWVIRHCEAKVMVVEDRHQLKKWESIAKRCKSVRHVVCIDPGTDEVADVISWDALMARGTSMTDSAFTDLLSTALPQDIATIVYTSGTTGEPKGAVLTHEQLLSEVEDVVQAFPISAADSSLCFLPFAHVLGRMELWLHMYLGFTLNFAEGIDRLKSNLKEVQPTVMVGVPRIFEKIYAGLLTQIEGQAWRKLTFDFLNRNNSWLSRHAADVLLYRKLRQGLGGRLRFVVSGGAPLESQVACFFQKAGLLLLEGYGLTETTGAICVNTPSSFEFGTVGKPLGDVEIKLADDGEILVKSKKVMRNYYKDEGSTEQSFQDGYFCTGDVGIWTSKGFLRITDRKKDLIKTAGGKYVAPQKLEGLLKLSPYISNALIHGDRKKYIVALITLNEPLLKKLARERGWSFKDYKTLVQRTEVRELVREHLAKVNEQLSSFETIKNFAILPEDFTIDKGELTASLKVRRKVVDEKFKDVIADLY